MNFSGATGRARVITASVTACALGALVLPGASAAPGGAASAGAGGMPTTVMERAVSAPGTITSRVRGTFGKAGTVRGTFAPDRFLVQRGQAYANGVLTATLRRGNGDVVGSVTRRVTIPVKSGTASASRDAGLTAAQGEVCDILNLVLGPLDLNLLGLEVHLKRVVLDIVARPGAGNLLGNLLCAVAGLLDGTGLLNELRLANALNRILALLRI